MAIKQRFCVNHPSRPAIGICVVTKAAICGECSTRYEGVNYSKEGLEILHKQRGPARGKPARALPMLVAILTPGLLYLVYLSYWMMAVLLMSMLHRDV